MAPRINTKRKTVDDENSESEAPETKKIQTSELSRISRKFHDNAEAQFNDSTISDVKIYINNKSFHAHKFILSRNLIFKKMLENPNLTEIRLCDEISHNEPDHGIRISISDVSTKSCETFLRYLYNPTTLDEVRIGSELVLVAHKFNDAILKKFCENHLVGRVKLKNVIQRLLLSVKTECQQLKKSTCELIARNFCSIKTRKDFKGILADDELLLAILEVFDDCEVTLLTDRKYEDDDLENKIKYLKSVDLTLIVKNHHFLTHKNVLKRNVELKKRISAAPPVIDGVSNCVNIPQFDENTFESFLKFIYTGEVKSSDISMKLLELAVKYDDKQLKNRCEAKFCNRLDCNNAIDFLINAIKYECKELKQRASSYIDIRNKQISTTDDFQKLLRNPKAASLIIKASWERPERVTNFFNGRFVLELPTDKQDVLSEKFAVRDRVCFMRLVLSEDMQYLGVFMSVINCASDFDLNYSFKLMSADEERVVKLMKSRRLFKSATDLKEETGWTNFISLERLENSEMKIVKDGKIVLEVDVTAI